MKNILLFFIVLISLVFSRRDCLQYAEKNVLGRSMRDTKDTFAISPSGHFYIHFDTLGNAAPDLSDTLCTNSNSYSTSFCSEGNGIPDYIDEVGVIADSARFVLIEELGYKEEPYDGEGGYDIYVKHYSSDSVYGFNYKDEYCTILDIFSKNSCLNSGGEWIIASYLEIDNDYGPQSLKSYFDLSPIEIMRITVGHEYFHGIQWGYEESLGNNRYFYEMTSMWFEDILIPNGNDYIDPGEEWSQCDGWAEKLLCNPTAEFDNTGDGYELALFGHYLSSFIDEKGINNNKESTIIREMWERFQIFDSSAFSAVRYTLENNYGISFIDAWTDFIARNAYNGIYGDMDNQIYYYIDQKFIDPITINSISLEDTIIFELELDEKSAAIKSFFIKDIESLITIKHYEENYTGRVALISKNDELEINNLYWGSDNIFDITFENVEVHFIYGIDSSSISLPIEIISHTVPLPPSNLKSIAAQDSIILYWDPSIGPGDDLYYIIFRDNDSLSITESLHYVDTNNIEGDRSYVYKITCRNNIGESSPSNSVTIASWPNIEDVLETKILKLYPNPIYKSNEFNILYSLNSEYSEIIIDFVDLKGQLINSISLSTSKGWHRKNIHNIINNNIASGIYFIILKSQDKIIEASKVSIIN